MIFSQTIFSKNLHGLIFYKHIVLSVKLRFDRGCGCAACHGPPPSLSPSHLYGAEITKTLPPSPSNHPPAAVSATPAFALYPRLAPRVSERVAERADGSRSSRPEASQGFVGCLPEVPTGTVRYTATSRSTIDSTVDLQY